jgi:hypothetical protein
MNNRTGPKRSLATTKREIHIMDQNADEQILVITGPSVQPAPGRVERGLGDSLLKKGVSALSVSVLKKNMNAFFDQLGEIVAPGAPTVGAFELSQIEITAQITGDGKVCLLGTGAKLEVQGGIKFVLNRTRS